MESQILATEAPPLRVGVVDSVTRHLIWSPCNLVPLCHTKGACWEFQKFGIAGALPLGMEVADPHKHTPFQTGYHAEFVRCSSKDTSVSTEIRWKKWVPRVSPPFNVTQGHRKWNRSFGYHGFLWVILSRTVTEIIGDIYRKKRKFFLLPYIERSRWGVILEVL